MARMGSINQSSKLYEYPRKKGFVHHERQVGGMKRSRIRRESTPRRSLAAPGLRMLQERRSVEGSAVRPLAAGERRRTENGF